MPNSGEATDSGMTRPKITYRFDRRRPPPDVLARRNRMIIQRRRSGAGWRSIAKDFGLSVSAVRRIVGAEGGHT
jgi:DNA invertase Pin-like site-specific DNA recombinase